MSNLAVDLHSHSGYAGGVGQITLEDVAQTMKYKGIDVFGTGDCLLPARMNELKRKLKETRPGLFSLPGDSSYFALQTEVIFTSRIPGYKNKITAHHVILFPDFKSVEKTALFLEKSGIKNTIGRPFITTESQAQAEKYFFEIKNIHPEIEIIPAHVMTPDGILGSKNRLKSIKEFYGKFTEEIKVIETGLSADPEMLGKIPDLHKMTMISNSDCHSAALNRIGREFTVLDTEDISYSDIIKALRLNKVVFTAEFNPKEGRYFNTGHRKDRPGHEKELILTDNIPEDLICPVCGKKMILGVNERCLELSDENLIPLKRRSKHLIPLSEAVAESLNTKSVKSKKVIETTKKIIDIAKTEINLWRLSDDSCKELLDNQIQSQTLHSIIAVKNGNFRFNPPGFDGNYGKLEILKRTEK
ncbi:MAG: hypothetical protein CSB55_02250 [Candidatus Cloacimonadota bacterium]|nr:MAG: hypothetical protein CSB55_02250 [Candidatus Cloacimonadota bacterium]